MKRLHLATLLITATLAAPHTTHATSPNTPDTIFAKINHAESRSLHAQIAADAATERLKTQQEAIDRFVASLSDADRSASRLQHKAATRQRAWERLHRDASRSHLLTPTSADQRLDSLLAAAEPRAHLRHHQELHILSSQHHAQQHLTRHILQRATLTTSLAHHTALSQTGQAEKAQSLKDALNAPPDAIARDLASTQEQLARSIAISLKNTDERDFHRFKGTFIHPVKSPPTHLWGPKKQVNSMSYVRHTGYTYAIPTGTPVRAAAAGLVAYADTFEGYGNIIILDHGTGYHTVYAHLRKLNVQPGQKVTRGDTLAESGESGSLDGPKLYFELRKAGQPIDPADWFIRR